jgi:hypothetical protein
VSALFFALPGAQQKRNPFYAKKKDCVCKLIEKNEASVTFNNLAALFTRQKNGQKNLQRSRNQKFVFFCMIRRLLIIENASPHTKSEPIGGSSIISFRNNGA